MKKIKLNFIPLSKENESDFRLQKKTTLCILHIAVSVLSDNELRDLRLQLINVILFLRQ